jgi:uncharacterized phage infection (PIP) family protein YhgE
MQDAFLVTKDELCRITALHKETMKLLSQANEKYTRLESRYDKVINEKGHLENSLLKCQERINQMEYTENLLNQSIECYKSNIITNNSHLNELRQQISIDNNISKIINNMNNDTIIWCEKVKEIIQLVNEHTTCYDDIWYV